MKIKPSFISLILIGIMLVSTFAFTIRQSIPRQKLPKTNIIEYQLDVGLKNTYIQAGATFLTFEYNSICENCLNQKHFLETLARDFKEQVFLEELFNETVVLPKLTITSNLGHREFINATEDEIFSTLCELMTFPPAVCAIRAVKT